MYTTLKQWVCLVILVVSTLFPLQVLSQQLENAILWKNLANHIADKNLPSVKMNVADCPKTFDTERPNRMTVQWIENTFYKWKEFDFNTDQVCLVLLKPEPQFLSKQEAQVLLRASQIWMLKQPAFSDDTSILDSSDPSLDLIPVNVPSNTGKISDEHKHESSIDKPISSPINPGDDNSLIPQNNLNEESSSSGLVIEPNTTGGGIKDFDDRTRVLNSTTYPFNTIVFVEMKQNGISFRASGFLVSPYTALTNGHVVYNQNSGSWATDVKIYAGQYETGDSVVRLYGIRSYYQLSSNISFTGGSGDRRYDYGTIKFTTPFNGLSTYMPVQFGYDIDNDTTILNMAGYPASAQGTSTYAQWFESNISSSQTTTYLAKYWMDTTGGSSGSPVWLFSEGLRHVVAIHCCSTDDSTFPNLGPRMGNDNQSIIEEWIAWTPPDVEDDKYEVNNTQATAYDLSNWEQTWLSTINGFGVQADDDWYRIHVDSGSERVLVDLWFTHADGDIDLILYDSSGTQMASSISTSNNEHIDYSVLQGNAYYYLKVYFDNKSNTYDLWWDDVVLPITDSDIEAQTEFIERFYLNILNRTSDPDGLLYWLNQIQTKSGSTVALGFV